MSQEKPSSEVYSPHRYLNEKGAPDRDKIFSVIVSPLKRHIDLWLLEHFNGQPEIIRESKGINIHLKNCDECRQKLKPELSHKQGDLPLSPE